MPGTIGLCAKSMMALAVLAGIVIPGTLFLAPARSVTAQESADTRQALTLRPVERDALRAEMRTMLSSISRILHGLSKGDAAMVEAAARASGKVSALDAQVREKLPAHFVQLDSKTHRRFDELASASGQRDKALIGVAVITGYCVSCHDTYRLEERGTASAVTR